jgi:hypothetical protein
MHGSRMFIDSLSPSTITHLPPTPSGVVELQRPVRLMAFVGHLALAYSQTTAQCSDRYLDSQA